jgi:hypothetical protein
MSAEVHPPPAERQDPDEASWDMQFERKTETDEQPAVPMRPLGMEG